MTIQEFKTTAIKKLSETSPSPQLDVEVLLQYSMEYSRTQLLLNRDKQIPQEKLTWLTAAVEKRRTGLPVAYITGHKEFFGYDFFVSPAVLIPKPDTEILVERAIQILLPAIQKSEKTLSVCDMCTGSGCIALSVLCTLIDQYNIPTEKLPFFTLVDISDEALKIAQKNTENLVSKYYKRDRVNQNLIQTNIKLVNSNLFEKLTGESFDVILTNPPYIPHSMVKELLKDGRNEPVLALDGDVTLDGKAAETPEGELLDDGLEIIRNLIPQAKERLSECGIILMETGEYNAEAAALLAQNNGFKTQIHDDLEGQHRVVEIY
ncbi:MAG: peptide chain release factor N(5)-glutamine methyltransferase [Treponema sp.]|nr:peptide chain release factor N(5)-glutamine methyltransferase [Treponema sp.]